MLLINNQEALMSQTSQMLTFSSFLGAAALAAGAPPKKLRISAGILILSAQGVIISNEE
jgi:hypothetical protein